MIGYGGEGNRLESNKKEKGMGVPELEVFYFLWHSLAGAWVGGRAGVNFRYRAGGGVDAKSLVIASRFFS